MSHCPSVCRQAKNEAGGGKGAFARVRIGALLHPPVLLEFADGASILQHRDGQM